jgi:hypothetical protein
MAWRSSSAVDGAVPTRIRLAFFLDLPMSSIERAGPVARLRFAEATAKLVGEGQRVLARIQLCVSARDRELRFDLFRPSICK